MPNIQKFINERHKYEVDTTYQRPKNAWSLADKQCLIDTIIKDEPMPLFFLNLNSKEDVFYIVDGQQRLEAIKDFYDNKIKLNGKFSGIEDHGKSFNAKDPLSDQQREDFLDYNLNFKILEDYDDERVRLIFSRLQRGKPLSIGERLNAKPGKIVYRMRELAKHPFMAKSTSISKGRYGLYPITARILFYEKYKEKQCNFEALEKFFEDFSKMEKTDKDCKNANSVLNFLAQCFPPDSGENKYLRTQAWIIGIYTMVNLLKKAYSLKGKEDLIRQFIEDFQSKVYNEDFRDSNRSYQRFYNNVRGGYSEKLIALRRDILIKEFLKKYELEVLDDKRQISNDEKIALYGRQSTCEMCSCTFKDFTEPEYHHKERYINGGKTNFDNIMVVCKDCHKKIHGKEKIKLPSNDEILEIDE